MAFCLLLRLVNLKLVLQFVELIDNLVLLSVELLLRFAVIQLGILAPFPIFPQSLTLQLGLVELVLQLTKLD